MKQLCGLISCSHFSITRCDRDGQLSKGNGSLASTQLTPPLTIAFRNMSGRKVLVKAFKKWVNQLQLHVGGYKYLRDGQAGTWKELDP